MQAQRKKQKRFFWMALIVIFALSGGYISATSATASTSTLVINEVMAANGSGLVDEDGDYSDWIEIYNPAQTPANLSGWSLTNDPNQPQQWEFPDITLGGGEYLVVFASGKDRTPTQPGQPLHTNFKLSKEGEFLALYSVLEDRFIDIVGEPFPPQFVDVSFGRTDDELTFAYMPDPTPGQPNNNSQLWRGTVEPVTFSIDHGYFEAPISVELSTSTPEAVIRFTIDGSTPTPTNGQDYTTPLQIDETTVLRAAAFKATMLPSRTNTRSYLFNDTILSQLEQPLNLPGSETLGAPKFITDHAHPIKNDRYAAELIDSLQAIPAISLVMPSQPLQSLYLRNFDQDREAERLVSVELLTPASALDRGFQVNAGIRPYGEAGNAKQSFKLYFRGEYGPNNLVYPLFDDSPVVTFDTLILQALPPGQTEDEIVRAAWLQKTQQEMTGLAAHQTFVHLYLNGTYWGLYQLTEQPNNDFMANYVGGEADDWYVADQDGPRHEISVAQTQALDDLFNIVALVSRVDESLVQPSLLAEPFNTLSAYFDPTEFSNFVLLHGYATSQDWPEHDWLAAVRLTDLPGRGRFLLNNQQTHASGGEIDLLTLTPDTRTPVLKMLFTMWMENPDFRITFADRAHQNLMGNGPLSDASAQARWDEISTTLDKAIAAELARWDSDTHDDAATTDRLQFDGTATRLLSMARMENYYPPLDPPVFNRGDSMVAAGETLAMHLPDTACDGCRIYYTTDGTDPRLFITGDVIPTAQEYNAPVELTANTRIKARVWQPAVAGGQPNWSALSEAEFNVVSQDNPLRITEVMYNPPGGDDFEYIELHNAGNAPVALARLMLDDGIRFRFPPNTPPLEPGQYAVLVSNPTAFSRQYPQVTVWGAYEGHLSNKGEHFSLLTPDGETLLEVSYDDEYGWPVSADGRGDSLTLVDLSANPGNPKSWRASDEVYGTPGF